MAVSTIYRYATHSDHEHAARVDGINAGYGNAEYVNGHGTLTRMPQQFADVAAVWLEAYWEGKDDYYALHEEEKMYGHNWRG